MLQDYKAKVFQDNQKGDRSVSSNQFRSIHSSDDPFASSSSCSDDSFQSYKLLQNDSVEKRQLLAMRANGNKQQHQLGMNSKKNDLEVR